MINVINEFPIIDTSNTNSSLWVKTTIPTSIVMEHNVQCIKNHGKSALMLLNDGGLTWSELFAVLNDRELKLVDDKGHVVPESIFRRACLKIIHEHN